ncbi:nuclear transport factor 2 family protein [Vibrio sp. FNV 38]|nr:nuclear transport factor 2 family protein [Vibrio sp. FNV 38]
MSSSINQHTNTIDTNKKHALAVINAISNGDWQYVSDNFADDAKIWVAGSMPISGYHDKTFVEGLGESNKVGFPNGMSFTAKALTAEGNRVAIEAETLGTHANGKIYNNHFHLLMVFRDGLVIEWKEYMDTEHANQTFFGA